MGGGHEGGEQMKKYRDLGKSKSITEKLTIFVNSDTYLLDVVFYNI